MLLHIINKSPFSHRSLKTCSQFCRKGDAIVLLEDGVYGISHPDIVQLIREKEIRVYAITADLAARGLVARLPEQVPSISYAKFVDLCVEFPKTKTW